MSPRQRIHELRALKEIAETLNSSYHMQEMLDSVLKKLLDVTGLTTGWIFLAGEQPEYACVADHNLPPALARDHKSPMCAGTCWCLNRFWDGRLKKAVNIIECKRIEEAIAQQRGDTAGIIHHATVPLYAGDEWFGLLNVAAPGKNYFDEEELALLQAVALQIGTAIKRTRLYQAQQKRADHFARLGEVSQEIARIAELEQLPVQAVTSISQAFSWPIVAFLLREDETAVLRALSVSGTVQSLWRILPHEPSGLVHQVLRNRKTILAAEPDRSLEALGISPMRSAIAAPIRYRDQLYGILLAGSPRPRALDAVDAELVQSLAEHITLAVENARLDLQRQELARLEERNRLARDLHDSVCQTLFSLTLTARAAESECSDSNPGAGLYLKEIRKLAQEALSEMRTLIWQLRPAGLEGGLIEALNRHAKNLGLTLHVRVEGVRDLPRAIEEALWRIGQEALNNTFRHAEVRDVWVELISDRDRICFSVEDQGSGFDTLETRREGSMGLLTMRERAEMLGGTFSIQSRPGTGTRIEVVIPLPEKMKRERGQDESDQNLHRG